MAVRTIETYDFGDMRVRYLLDEDTGIPEMMLYPQGREPLGWESKVQNTDSLVQLKILGDSYAGSYSGGISMRQSESVFRMKFQEQNLTETEDTCRVDTICWDERGYRTIHHLLWEKGGRTLQVYVEFQNHSSSPVTLEMLSSFSLGGISPFLSGDGAGQLYLHRVRGVWSMEGRLETTALEDLQLEPSWALGHGVRCERFGQAGSLPVNKFFPFAVLEDRKNHVFWGAELAHNAAWQMEVYRIDEGVSLSGGLGDREFGHWKKTVEAGQSFETPHAFLTVEQDTDIDRFSQRLTSCQEAVEKILPEREKELPLIFNEYCTTWGNPSHENIKEILKAVQGKGFSYFVIDCGWFKKDGVPWGDSVGDYIPSDTLFPLGLKETVSQINKAGMEAGIWFEIDNVGKAAGAYNLEEHLLKRDGITLTTQERRFWDMSQDWVKEYLQEKVIGTLKDYGFTYIKMDYNDTIGIGCDGGESLGEGLRQNMEASYEFVEKIREEIPQIVIENCASGGHKLEPKMMGISSMASFSDAHECREIPVIAANLHRVILPRQSQIWAVIRKDDSLKRIIYSMCASFLGRCCLSGDVTELSEKQWEAVDQGLAFYRQIVPAIRQGVTRFFGTKEPSWRHLKGWQGILREGQEEAYAVFHVFEDRVEGNLSLSWEDKEYEISRIYPENADIKTEGNKLVYRPKENWEAVAVSLRRIPSPRI